MNMQKLAAAILCLSLANSAVPAAEKQHTGRSGPASAVETVFHGIGMGAFTGLTAGWVRYAGEYNMQNVWESVGYGALAGLGVGVGAAVIGPNGKGNLVLTDVEQGGGLGTGVGFFWGVVAALFTGESERVGYGLAWGQLAGIVAGMGYAGFKIAHGGYRDGTGQDRDDTAVQCSIGVSGGGASPHPVIRVTKRF